MIMSVRGIYAGAILAGFKTVELRRKFPEIALGTRLWIYETLPTGAVVGFVTASHIEKAEPATIWLRHRDSVGVDYITFSAYFRGASQAVAILMTSAYRIVPITTAQIRVIRGRFHPPQVATRLTTVETAALRSIAKALE